MQTLITSAISAVLVIGALAMTPTASAGPVHMCDGSYTDCREGTHTLFLPLNPSPRDPPPRDPVAPEDEYSKKPNSCEDAFK